MNHVSKLHEVTPFQQFRPRPSRVFIREMGEMMAAADRSDGELGVLVISIDQLKTSFHQYDQHTESAILNDIAGIIASRIGPFGQFTRNDDDDFLICFPVQSMYDLVGLAATLPHLISQYTQRDAVPLTVTVSVGATLYPQDKGTPRDLLFHAIEGMHEARAQGGNGFKIFDFAQRAAQINARSVSEAVMSGMHTGQIELHYQPTIELCSGRPLGVEVLMRWRQSVTTLRSPAEFLPYIEGADLLELDMHVLDAAIRQSVAWQAQGVRPALSVNLSPRHFAVDGFAKRVKQVILCHVDFDPSELTIEILESHPISDLPRAVAVISELRDLGIRFYLDDFGTGHSAAAYLKQLPIDGIKIDQVFTRNLPDGQNHKQDRAIIAATLSMAKAFGVDVVAEGLESADAITEVIKMGCLKGQGFFFAKPMPASDLSTWFQYHLLHPIDVGHNPLCMTQTPEPIDGQVT